MISNNASSVTSQLIVGQAVLDELLGHQEFAERYALLLAGVSRQLDDLETVSKRPGNGIELVGRGDEHHLRQIEGHFEVVVGERVVLFRIEDLEQRRGRVAAEIVTELVDLVEDKHWVVGPAFLDALNDAAR